MKKTWKMWIGFLNLYVVAINDIPKMMFEIEPYDPNPNKQSIVSTSNPRVQITVLTPQLFRIERLMDTKGHWDNCPTLSVIHRNFETPHFTTKTHADGGIIISTDSAEIYYSGAENFKPNTLQGMSKKTGQTWRYGDDFSVGNLFGTIRTLDTLGPTSLNCSQISDPDLHCEFGFVSRSGWAILNDTLSPRLRGNDDWWDDPPIVSKPQVEDFYLFIHGRDHKTAIADYAKIGGRVPLPPRYMFGILWTRWFNYDSTDLKQLVAGFSVRGLPLDVLVIDMNWHIKPWWGSYTVDKRIIPDAKKLFDWMHARGVAVGLNVHDCLLAEKGCPAGTLSSDDEEFFAAYTSRLGEVTNGDTIPIDLKNREKAIAKEDVVFGAYEGLSDMWWIDWQQGDTKIGGLEGGRENPTIWLNKMRYTNRKRWNKKERGSILSRFGGLGSHRYGVGFSGDVQMLDWENLSYQPYFSATGANVLFSSWSHDVTGPNRDPELLVRWTQWGAFSGVLRFHERGMSSGPCAFTNFPLPSKECANVDLWANLPSRFGNAIRDTMILRERLVPYMYTEARKTFDSGVPWIRPLYYEYPELEIAYNLPSQYMFGDHITVAPVVVPSDPGAPTSTEAHIWVPPGLWYSVIDGALIDGGSDGYMYKRHFDLTEIPWLVRAGTILPQRMIDPTHGSSKLVGLAKSNFSDLVFEIFPGSDKGQVSIYEDDGTSVDYIESSAYGFIVCSYTRSEASLSVKIDFEGDYSRSIGDRRITIRIPNVMIPERIESSSGTHSTRFDGHDVYLDVTVETDSLGPIEVEIVWSQDVSSIDLSGIKSGLYHARLAKAVLDEVVLTPGTHPCWHSTPCGYKTGDDFLIRSAAMGERLHGAKTNSEMQQLIADFIEIYKVAVDKEITVDNVLRTNTDWAPTQGGWPEATRLRVNYAVATMYWSMQKLCMEVPNFIMPLICHKSTPSINSTTHQPDHVVIILDG